LRHRLLPLQLFRSLGPDDAIADFDAALIADLTFALHGRGLAKVKKGDTLGGEADIAAAKAIDPRIADLLAKNGFNEPAAID